MTLTARILLVHILVVSTENIIAYRIFHHAFSFFLDEPFDFAQDDSNKKIFMLYYYFFLYS